MYCDKPRRQYDMKSDVAHGEAAGVRCCDESLTQQQFVQDVDLNVLIRRLNMGENPPIPLATDKLYYGDVSEAPDLRTALDRVREAESRFMALDPALRARFHNSVANLWDFLQNPANDDEAVKLGLLVRPGDKPVAGSSEEKSA